MELNEYQSRAAKYERISGRSLEYLALGLMGESGEVAEKVKKLIRDGAQIDNLSMIKELGDVLWYISRLSAYFGTDLNDVANINLNKLESRLQRGALAGNGDDR